MMDQVTRREQEVFDALRYRIEVDANGTRRYYNRAGQLHRENGPAVEYANGDKFWYQNDQCHRTDGSKSWYINGEHMSEAEFNQSVKDYV